MWKIRLTYTGNSIRTPRQFWSHRDGKRHFSKATTEWKYTTTRATLISSLLVSTEQRRRNRKKKKKKNWNAKPFPLSSPPVSSVSSSIRFSSRTRPWKKERIHRESCDRAISHPENSNIRGFAAHRRRGESHSFRFKGGGFKRGRGTVVYFEKPGYERQLTECSVIRM